MNIIQKARELFASLTAPRIIQIGGPVHGQDTFSPTTSPTRAPSQATPTPNSMHVYPRVNRSKPTVTPTSTPQAIPTVVPDLERRIRAGFTGQLKTQNVPALQYTHVFTEAAQKYPMFRANPYLMPQVAILETTGGKYITRPNNLINYGIKDPKINNLFSQVGIEEALRRSLKEIGETGNTYKRFRTGKKLSPAELQDFARTYEPENPSYYDNLLKGIEYFERQ